MSTSSVQKQQDQNPEVTLDDAMTLARGHHMAGNYVLAERTYRDILRAVPDYFQATHMLGVLLFQTGNFDEAKDYLQKAAVLASAPDDLACWNNYGSALVQLGEYDAAIEAFDRAISISGTYVDPLINKSYLLWLMGRYEESADTCRRTLELEPNHTGALNTLGMALSRLSQYGEAMDCWEKATEINSEDAVLWTNWGNALRETGKLAESEKKCRKAFELAPDNAEVLNNLANALRDSGSADEAIDLYRKATNQQPDHYIAHNNLAIALVDCHRYEEAVVSARYAVAFKKDFAEGHSILSRALTEMGEHAQSVAAARKAVRFGADNAAYYLDLADALMRTNQNDDGSAAMEEALRREPDSPRAWMKLAEVRDQLNDVDGALAAIDSAIEMCPDMPALWARKAMLCYGDNRMDEALSHIDKAIELAPRWAVPIQNKAEIMVSLNRNDEAAELAQKVLKMNKKMPAPYHTLATLGKIKSEDDVLFKEMKDLEGHVTAYGQDGAAGYFYGMGDIYERLKKYDIAFDYFNQANARKKRMQPDAQERADLAAVFRKKFTPEYIKSCEGKGYESDLPVFIVGMPRSGTTLTEQIISSHPDVFGAGELSDLGKTQKAILERKGGTLRDVGEDYVRRIKVRDKTGKALRITDKMPGNFHSIGLILTALPHAKIIHCRRNPIDTGLSCYKQNFAKGQYWSYDLADIAAEYKHYLSVMEVWREVFAGRFLEIDYEETVGNFEEQARKLIDYVGLEWDDACLEPHKQKRAVLTASKAQVTKPVYKTSVDKWKIYEKQLQPLVRELLPDQALPE